MLGQQSLNYLFSRVYLFMLFIVAMYQNLFNWTYTLSIDYTIVHQIIQATSHSYSILSSWSSFHGPLCYTWTEALKL